MMGDHAKFGTWAQGLAGVGKEGEHHLRVRKVQAQHAIASGSYSSEAAQGGFLVPAEHAGALRSRMYSTGRFLRLCDRLPMRSQKLKIPVIDEDSRKDGSRFGGLALNYVREGEQIPASQSRFGQTQFVTNALKGIAYASDELFNDASALGAMLERFFALEASFKAEHDLINGDGVGKPLGLLNSTALITVDPESGQAAGTVVEQNVLKMWARLWVGSHENAVWLINHRLAEQLGTAASGGTKPALIRWTESGPLLLGRPVISTEYQPTAGTVGDILLVDPSEILIGDRDLRMTASEHLRFANSEWAFRYCWRFDAQPAWARPTTPIDGGSTVSPYIALAARA